MRLIVDYDMGVRIARMLRTTSGRPGLQDLLRVLPSRIAHGIMDVGSCPWEIHYRSEIPARLIPDDDPSLLTRWHNARPLARGHLDLNRVYNDLFGHNTDQIDLPVAWTLLEGQPLYEWEQDIFVWFGPVLEIRSGRDPTNQPNT